MNKEQQIKHFDLQVAKMRETLLAKDDDYAGEENRLANFELVARIAGVTPDIVALVLIGIKVVRLGVLLNTKDAPKNEPIGDSVLDLANYAMLLDAILVEKKISANSIFIPAAVPEEIQPPMCATCGKQMTWRSKSVNGKEIYWLCPHCGEVSETKKS